jgi:magnesium-transporting ATPase (P-type)
MSQTPAADLARLMDSMDPTITRSLALHSRPPSDTCGMKEESISKDDEDTLTPMPDSLDALIADLEDEDGKEPDPEVLTIGPGADQPIPSALLQTSLATGLTDFEVIASRRKYGWNRLHEQKRSNIVKFLKLFVGSVQFVMEVSTFSRSILIILAEHTNMWCRLLRFWLLVYKTGLTSVSSVHFFSSMPSSGLLKNTTPVTLSTA